MNKSTHSLFRYIHIPITHDKETSLFYLKQIQVYKTGCRSTENDAIFQQTSRFVAGSDFRSHKYCIIQVDVYSVVHKQKMCIAKHGIWPSFALYFIFPIRLYFFNTSAHTKILNKEKKTTSRHVCLCFFSLSYIPQLVLSFLAFVLSKAFHHISFLQQIQQLLFCL